TQAPGCTDLHGPAWGSTIDSCRARALMPRALGRMTQMETTEATGSEPVFHYSRPGLTFDVFENRIDIQERGGLLGMGGKKTSILFRNITDVQVEGFSKQLTIKTSGGERLKWQLG